MFTPTDNIVLTRLSGCTLQSIEELKSNDTKNVVVRHRALFMAQYRIKCNFILQIQNVDSIPVEVKINATKQLLYLNRTIQAIYHAINEPDDVNSTKNDEICLKNKLIQLGDLSEGTKLLDLTQYPASFSQQLRLSIQFNTFPRLVTARIRQWLLAFTNFTQDPFLRSILIHCETFNVPFFTHLAWLFFVPRLGLNLLTLAKHVIPGPWMSPEEQNIPVLTRFESYLNLHRRIFELCNDITWFSGGLYLALYGANPLLNVLLQSLEMSQIIVRSVVEIRRLIILKQHYLNAQNPDASDLYYRSAIESRIEYEKQVTYLMITNHILLITSLACRLPFMLTITPLAPLIGASIAIVASIRFCMRSRILNMQPNTNLRELKKLPTSSTQRMARASSFNLYTVPTVLSLAPLLFVAFSMAPTATTLVLMVGAIHHLAVSQYPKSHRPKMAFNAALDCKLFPPMPRRENNGTQPENQLFFRLPF